jgi:DNA invertase Pin-like site-specific DNA recombinase
MIRAACAKERPFDLILVRDQSRFGRSQADGAIRAQLRESGVAIDNIQNPSGDMDEAITPGGELVESIQSAVDIHQRKMSTVHMKAGQKAKARKGGLAGAQATCYGYKQEWLSVGNGRPVRNPVPDKPKAKLVREMFRRYIAGDSLLGITRWLNGLGVSAPRGVRWYESTVRKILSNETYLGRAVYGRIKKVKHPLTRTPVNAKNDGEVIRFDNAFPAIVDQESFDLVQRILARNESTRPQGGHPGNTLRGVGKCAVCGWHLAHQRNTNTGKWYYMCGYVKTNGAAQSDPACKGILDSEYVDEVVSLFLERVLSYKLSDLTAQIERYNTAATNLTGLSATEALSLAIGEQETNIANLTRAIAKRGDSQALLTALENAESTCENLVRQRESLVSAVNIPKIDTNEVLKARSEIKDTLRRRDRKKFRAILAAIVAEVRCDWNKRKKPDVNFNYLFEDPSYEPAGGSISDKEHKHWKEVIRLMGSSFRGASRAKKSNLKSGTSYFMSITMPRAPLTFVPKWSLAEAGKAAQRAVREISEALA